MILNLQRTGIGFLFLLILFFQAIGYAADRRVEALYGKGAEIVPGEIIVKFSEKIGNVESSSQFSRIYQTYGALSHERIFKHLKYKNASKRKMTDLTRIYKFKVPENADILDICQQLKNQKDVIYAEPNFYCTAQAVPNDSLYPRQGHLPQINMPAAWDIVKGDKKVVFGIVGTGVDWNHPDLAAAIWENPGETLDGRDDDGNGFIDDIRGWDFVTGVSNDAAPGEDGDVPDNDPMDFDGHETHVAGLAAAVTNNEIGVAGVSWGCTIMPVRAGYHTKDGKGRSVGDALARGVTYAADNGADFINYSWSSFGQTIINAARYAFEKGALVINSAGNNDDQPGKDPNYSGALGSLSYVLTVAAVDDRDLKASYSSYGSWVTVSAPGGDLNRGRPGLLSTVFDDSYASFQGTSMASPVVTGLAGLLKSYNPEWTNADIMFRIVETADNIYDKNPDYIGMLGSGRINALRALTEEIHPLPKIKLLSIAVNDSSTGNSNSKLDIGETAEVIVSLKNTWASASNVVVNLFIDDPEITVVNGTSTMGELPGLENLDASEKNNSEDPLVVSVSPNSVPHRIHATIQVIADGIEKNFNWGLAIDPRILVVDDDTPGRNGPTVNVEDYYYDALDDIDVSFDYWDEFTRGKEPRSDTLGRYDTVIWFCEKSTPSLNSADRAAIKRYLNVFGGNLILFGQDIGWDLNDASGDSNEFFFDPRSRDLFYEPVLHARYIADNAGFSRVLGVQDDPITDGLAFNFEQPGRNPTMQSPDVVDTLNGGIACLNYPDGRIAGVRDVSQSNYGRTVKTVYFSFGGIEAIADPQTRRELLARILNWVSGIRVHYSPLKDVSAPVAREISAVIDVDSDTLQLQRVELLYTVNGEYPETVVEMTADTNGTYHAMIPAIDEGVVDYQILVEADNGYYAPRIHYSYKIGRDTEAPSVTSVEKLYNSMDKKGPFQPIAKITDNTLVDTNRVFVHFWTNRMAQDSVKALAAAGENEFSGEIQGDFQYGDTLMYYFSAADTNSNFNYAHGPVDTVIIGYEDFEHGLWEWQADTNGTWGLEEIDPEDGFFSLNDSPGGAPKSGNETTLTLKTPIDLSTTNYAVLTFWSKNKFRPAKDFGYIELSADGGETWNVIKKFSSLKPTWKYYFIPIGEYTGPGFENVLMRLRVKTKSGDISEKFNGWQMDDIFLREDIAQKVEIAEQTEAIPETYTLEQNYPNPFNPTTTITYRMPRAGKVKIEIYNMLGQRIRTLVERNVPAGNYQVTWDAKDDFGKSVATGMYLYRMQSGDFSAMRKLILLK
ncbi:MAG: S8 family serine peptidase [Calditrichaeota bacterium]|nr:S8 family serine peptidase [Calditrichota bacterium]